MEDAPLTPLEFHTLLALADQDRHGYAIIKEILRESGGRLRPGTGSLYTAIQRMSSQGLIEESSERPEEEQDDQRRRYYRLTGLGRSVAAAEVKRLDALVSAARPWALEIEGPA